MFWTGMALAPLLLQGWIPSSGHLPEHPGVDHVGRVASTTFSSLGLPGGSARHGPGYYLVQLALVWGLGIVPGTLYILFNPDGIAHPDRFS